ncbi:MAG: hypothetical protein ABI076_12115 [Acidobacteriaceae bacterium]
MKYLLSFLLFSSLAFGAVRPIDRVHAYAGNQKVTVRLDRGIYWVELEDSDIFGVGYTLDDAAEDFMENVDLEARESHRPYLTQPRQQQQAPFVCLPTDHCI